MNTLRCAFGLAFVVAAAGCSGASDGMDAGSDAGAQAPVCDGTCGDHVCNASETCSSCPGDCSCTATNPCGFDAGVAFDFLGDTLQLQSTDKTTCVWLTRTLSGGCATASCLSAKFTVTSVRINRGGTLVTLGASDSLTWTDTHHNLADVADLTNANTHFTLSMAGMNHPAVLDPSTPTTLHATATVDGGLSFCPASLVPYP